MPSGTSCQRLLHSIEELQRVGFNPPDTFAPYAGRRGGGVSRRQRADASRTIVLMRSMLPSRMGQVLSVDTHSARPRPQPHEQRASLAARSAFFLAAGDKSEKLTTPMARSSKATPAFCDTK